MRLQPAVYRIPFRFIRLIMNRQMHFTSKYSHELHEWHAIFFFDSCQFVKFVADSARWATWRIIPLKMNAWIGYSAYQYEKPR